MSSVTVIALIVIAGSVANFLRASRMSPSGARDNAWSTVGLIFLGFAMITHELIPEGNMRTLGVLQFVAVAVFALVKEILLYSKLRAEREGLAADE